MRKEVKVFEKFRIERLKLHNSAEMFETLRIFILLGTLEMLHLPIESSETLYITLYTFEQL